MTPCWLIVDIGPATVATPTQAYAEEVFMLLIPTLVLHRVIDWSNWV